MNSLKSNPTITPEDVELLDIVDEAGEPVGEVVPRDTAHTTGIRHRTSHVWVLRQRGDKPELLLQKRSYKKDSFPGCLDISSAGHIPAGVGFVPSALRELYEELGITAQAEELIYIGQRRFEVRDTFRGKPYWDRQVSNVYLLRRDMEAEEFSLQEAELDSVMWMDFSDCVQLVKYASAPTCIQMEELDMIRRYLETVKQGDPQNLFL